MHESTRIPVLNHGHFKNKSIAIVGNSVRIFEQKQGAEIDNHEFVVRFNLAWPTKANEPRCTGSKTTHMMVGGREFKTPDAADNFAKIMRNNPSVAFFSAMGDSKDWTLESPIPLLPFEINESWRKELETEYSPTSGSALIYYFLNYCQPRSVDIYGFDGLKSRIWYKNQRDIHAKIHSSEIESSYLKKVERGFSHVSVKPYEEGTKHSRLGNQPKS